VWPLHVENRLDESVDLEITITAENESDTQTIFSEELSLAADEYREEVYSTTKKGRYEVKVIAGDETKESFQWLVCEGYYSAVVSVDPSDGEKQLNMQVAHGDPESANCSID
jgi:fructose-1,6-bisphosphatase